MDDDLDEWFPRDREPQEEARPVEKREPVANKVYGQRGERWTRDYMLSLCGIKLEKRSDAPIELPNGKVVFPGTNQLDHFGYAKQPVTGLALHFEVEVKTYEGEFPLSQISAGQVEKLDEAVAGGAIGIIALTRREGPDIVQMSWVSWPQRSENGEYRHVNQWVTPCPLYGSPTRLVEWKTINARSFAWITNELRARRYGNFQAKSIRCRDHDLLEEFAIVKVKNCWVLPGEHWLGYLLGLQAQQPSLL